MLYGIIFADYLKDYDFWGFCDIDLILGDLSEFITNERLEKYDRIGIRGHLTLIRNIPEINSLSFYLGSTGWMHHYANFTFYHESNCGFDESVDTIRYFELTGHPVCWDLEMADISTVSKAFKIRLSPLTQERISISAFRFSNGKVYGLLKKGNNDFSIYKEFAYLHMQKRKMKINCTGSNTYYIIPDEFVDTLPTVLSLPSETEEIAFRKSLKRKKTIRMRFERYQRYILKRIIGRGGYK